MRLISLLFMMFLSAAAQAERRVAFLVGNNDYEHAPGLSNPVRDTALIAQTLRGLDFEVTSHQNLGRLQIGQRLAAFLKETKDADVTLFYFAGHGMQYDRRNYLIGTDAQLRTELDISSEALELNKVVELLERNSRAALVFIDACRDNPLANRFYSENFSQTRALATRGLAPVDRAFQGSMITFSASPGQVAYDGEGQNSPFATALARHLPTDNLEVLSLMKRVIRDVKAETGDLQVPMVTNDLTAEIYLRLGGGQGSVLALKQEEALFDAAADMNSLRGWDVFLSRYPSGHFREMALAAREKLQVTEIAETAGVTVEQLSPQNVSREVAANIEQGLGLGQDDNRQVQAALNRLGYNAGPEDGVMGRRTRQAVANFQAAVNLPVTGVVTSGTAGRLGLNLAQTETSDKAIESSPDARRYDPEKLALIESDPRLHRAAKALAGKEFRYGYFNGALYLAVLDWGHPNFDAVQTIAERAGGYITTISSERENQFVAELSLSDERMWRPNTDRTAMFGPLLGLHQLPNSREPAGGWVWMNGEQPSYSSWHPSEPTNHDNKESNVVYFIPFERFESYRQRPRALVWGDVWGSWKSYVIEID